jgi:hypothetical protein
MALDKALVAIAKNHERMHDGVPPAGPDIKGPQGCPLCGGIRDSRVEMLAHYSAEHHVSLKR